MTDKLLCLGVEGLLRIWILLSAGLMRVLEALDVAAAQQSPAEAAAAARATAGARADTERPLRLAVRVLLLYLQVRTVQPSCPVLAIYRGLRWLQAAAEARFDIKALGLCCG